MVVSNSNEVAEHFFGQFEVGNYAVFHGANRLNGAGSSAEHLFGSSADSFHGAQASAVSLNRNNGWLVCDNSFAFDVYKCVCSP
jgi:hypothetical protein